MTTHETYYLDAGSLGAATAVYSDSSMTVLAADGFYSDGTIVREQVNGVLLPRVICPSCVPPCGGDISASGEVGVYYIEAELGSDIGAVIIKFDPISVPDGFLATFNNITYNGLSSPNYGWLQGSAGLPTYVGSINDDCGLVSNSPFTLNEYKYNGAIFEPLNTTKQVTVLAPQVKTVDGTNGNGVFVIPKIMETPSILSLEIIGACSGTVFNVSISCPSPLTSFPSSIGYPDSSTVCDGVINQTYYVAHVTGGSGVLGIYDLVFSDSNGQNILNQGYYKTSAAGSNNWFFVNDKGVIMSFGQCLMT